MRKLLFFAFLFICVPGWASTLYWYGGSGNYSDYANHWSNNSGNAPASPASAAPTSTDDVVFDSASGATTYTVTVDATATCRDMTWGAAGDGTKPTLNFNKQQLFVYGNVSLVTGMSVATDYGYIIFSHTSGTKTFTTNGVALKQQVHFAGSGGTTQLADNLTYATAGISLVFLRRSSGAFDANSKLITIGSNASGNAGIQGDFSGANSIYDLTLSVTGATKGVEFYLMNDITVAHTLTMSGNSAINRALVRSDTKGTRRTITCNGTVTVTNIGFVDITGAGSASWDFSAQSDVGGGVVSNCSGITFPAGQNCFWVHSNDATSHNWSDLTGSVGTYWMSASGGSTKVRVPLIQDVAIFDNNSFPHSGCTVVQDMPRIPTVTWAGVDGLHPVLNTPAWTTSTTASFFGSITLVAGMTLTASTQTYTFEGRGVYTLTSAGKTWGKPIAISAPGGTLTLQDAYASSGNSHLALVYGTFDANNQNVTLNTYFDSDNSNTRTLRMGNGTWTFVNQQYSTNWYLATTTGLTFNAGNSTIKLTATVDSPKIFNGGGLQYNNLWISGSGSTEFQLTGANTFAGYLKDDGTAAHSITFPNVTTTVGDFQVNGSGGSHLITLQRTGGSGTWTIAKTGGGRVYSRYVNISNSVASPAATFSALGSTDGGGNTAWTIGTVASFYISPSGDDSAAGVTSGTAWKTFAHAIPLLLAGDTLSLADGTYGSATTGGIIVTSTSPKGSSGAPITIKATNERQAHFVTDGSWYAVRLSDTSYYTIQGLWVTSADNANTSSTSYDNFQVNRCDHVTLYRNIADHTNRYVNSVLYFINQPSGPGNLVEENEGYAHHRDGILIFGAGGSNYVTVRRNYINGRGYGEIVPGSALYPSGTAPTGCAQDALPCWGWRTLTTVWGGPAFTAYPAANNRFENNISESNWIGFEVEAAYNYVTPNLVSANNLFYGNISIEDNYGFYETARAGPDDDTNYQPQGTQYVNDVAIRPHTVGFYGRGMFTSTWNKCTAFGGVLGSKGFVWDFSGEPTVKRAGFTATNLIAIDFSDGYSYYAVDPSAGQSWVSASIDYYDSYSSAASQLSASVTATHAITTAPQYGNCLLYLPLNTPLLGAGLGGADYGAQVLYKYIDTTLTSTPLWLFDTLGVGSGEFRTYGATAAGLNDTASTSLYNIHTRVNMQCNSCLLPRGSPPGIKLTQTDTADAPTRSAYCSGLTPDSDTTGRQMSYGGTPTTTTHGATVSAGASDLAVVFLEGIFPATGTITWTGGTAFLNFKVTGAIAGTISSIHVCRLNSSNTNQATVGSSSGLSVDISTTGTKVIPVTLTTQAAAAGDKLEIILGVTSAAGGTLIWEPSQTFDTPYIYTEGGRVQTSNFFFGDSQ